MRGVRGEIEVRKARTNGHYWGHLFLVRSGWNFWENLIAVLYFTPQRWFFNLPAHIRRPDMCLFSCSCDLRRIPADSIYWTSQGPWYPSEKWSRRESITGQCKLGALGQRPQALLSLCCSPFIWFHFIPNPFFNIKITKRQVCPQ